MSFDLNDRRRLYDDYKPDTKRVLHWLDKTAAECGFKKDKYYTASSQDSATGMSFISCSNMWC